MIIFKKKIAMFLIVIFSIFVILLASSYAYFTTRIMGTDIASDINIKTAVSQLIFIDGVNIQGGQAYIAKNPANYAGDVFPEIMFR